MEQEIQVLRKQVKQLKLMVLLLFGMGLTSLLISFTDPVQKFGIIRAKGIVLEDSAGRDRILIGAPIPFSKNRVRTDTARVRLYWAKNYEDKAGKYMEWYNNYYHGAEGMVVMNDKGFDRVLVGDKLADPNTGRRMFEAAGILWNNPEGWELGGAGANTLKNGTSRSVMGVDDKDGEAVHIIALEDGTKGIVIGGENGRLLIGMSNKNGKWFKNEELFTGIKYFDPTGKLLWEQAMQK